MSEAPETEAIEAPAEAAVAEKPAETPNDTPSSEPSPLDGIEAVAREGGWVPKEEFKGDPEKWLDAPNFVLNAAKILPHVTRDLREARDEIKDVKKTIRSLEGALTKTSQREYTRAIKDIERRLAEAHADNDLQGVMDASEDLAELKADAKAEAKAPKDEPKTDEHYEVWVEANPWWNKDRAMTGAAIEIANEVEQETGLKTGKRFFAEVDKRVREAFPHKFKAAENPNRSAPAVADVGAPRGPRGKTFADLPPEARAMCDEFCRDIKGFTREKFLKDYQW